eukprot:scaffold102394_cov55-Phaeocystis_antarctica.AAC.1
MVSPLPNSLTASPLLLISRARGAPGKRDAERLHAEELVVGEHGGHDERQVVHRHAGEHNLALGVGHGGVALHVGVLVDRRHERNQATDAEEQEEGKQEEDEQHAAHLLEVHARLQVQERDQGDS